MKKKILAAALVALFGVFLSSANAAIPRKTELALQAKAPEKLEIEVLEVEKKRRLGFFDITATVKVLKVQNSASGLAVGKKVTIKYSVPAKPIPGAPPSVVAKGIRYAAFLMKTRGKGSHYKPDAASGSFEKLAKK